jgi:inhibitor of cysteine peptidase
VRRSMLLLGLVMMGCASSQPSSQPSHEWQLSEPDNGRTINAQVSDVIKIRLPANATTGYVWSVQPIAGKTVRQEGPIAYEPTGGANPPPGTGGFANATFTVVGKGESRITLQYSRPWEADKPPVKTFSLTIQS